MVFSSLIFLFRFLPLILLIYYIVPGKFKNMVLLSGSLVFYAWGEPKYVLIMISSTLVNYIFGILIEDFKKKDKISASKYMVVASVIVNLSVLGFFKYADLLINTANKLTGSGFHLLEIALPVGVSFYTFQTMSYTIDVYRGNVAAQRNIITFGTYVTMFPQLIAGPIVKYKSVADELNNRKGNIDTFADGIGRFITGLGKKVLLANNIGNLWDTIKAVNPENMSVLSAWLGIIAFTFQIYFDFSGYSDMAIGLGKMFGFNFEENFNYPYISKSVTEFFRRWHISLGTWFREYVYIPLGGNRCSTYKHIRNILVVWILTGLWHGASYNFMLWGLYYGVILILEKIFLKKYIDRLPAFIQHIYTLLIIITGWVIFSFEDMGQLGRYLKTMFSVTGGKIYDDQSIYLLYTHVVLLIILIVASTPAAKKLVNRLFEIIKSEAVKTVLANVFYVVVFAMVIAYLVDSSYNPFLYFRF